MHACCKVTGGTSTRIPVSFKFVALLNVRIKIILIASIVLKLFLTLTKIDFKGFFFFFIFLRCQITTLKFLVNFFLNECHFDRNLCSNLRKQVLGFWIKTIYKQSVNTVKYIQTFVKKL